MKLYMTPLSPNVRRVRITAAVLQLPLDEIHLDFSKGEHKQPDYLALNPNGAVPTLVDGDFVLSESRAIMCYLAAKKPQSGLIPPAEASRADSLRWQLWDASHFSPQLGTLTFEKIIKPMLGLGAPRQDKIEEAFANLRRYCGVLDGCLQDKDYLVGDALTIADLTVACSLMYANRTDVSLGDFANIRSWFSRISDLDAWKTTDPAHGVGTPLVRNG